MTEKEVEDLADEEFGRLAALVAKEAKRREAHSGIKFANLEAYANFFVYRWSHVRK